MSNIYTSAEQLIGRTPLLELSHIEKEYKLKAKIIAKLEYFQYDVPDEATAFLFPEEAKMQQKEKLPLLYLEAGLHGYR